MKGHNSEQNRRNRLIKGYFSQTVILLYSFFLFLAINLLNDPRFLWFDLLLSVYLSLLIIMNREDFRTLPKLLLLFIIILLPLIITNIFILPGRFRIFAVVVKCLNSFLILSLLSENLHFEFLIRLARRAGFSGEMINILYYCHFFIKRLKSTLDKSNDKVILRNEFGNINAALKMPSLMVNNFLKSMKSTNLIFTVTQTRGLKAESERI
ncbi:MAG: hypothetical protein JXB60_03285 [Candidatus Cloacimonetes bacterium]|nr:hypothetical protein [Candidatus Cloacimonadota bacterium]